MVKRLLIGGKGISFFSKIGFMNELARGEVVWRPLANAKINKINKIEVGILTPPHRTLSHVTLQFVERIALRLKQVELVARGIEGYLCVCTDHWLKIRPL